MMSLPVKLYHKVTLNLGRARRERRIAPSREIFVFSVSRTWYYKSVSNQEVSYVLLSRIIEHSLDYSS